MRKRIILLILILLNLATIFFFSHQDAKTSTAVSNAISKQIEVRTPDYSTKNQGERNVLHTHVQRSLRRSAHAILFCSLGILTFLFLRTFKIRWFWYFCALPVGFLIALSDEIHQLYVPGRTFGWDDISYDMLGFILGMLTVLLTVCIVKCFQIIKRNKKNCEITG